MVGVHDHPLRVVSLVAGRATARGDTSEGCHWRRATDHVVGLFRCGELSTCSVLVHGGAVPHLLDVLQCTTGAELHPQLRVEPQDIVLATGHNPHADSCTSMSAPTFAWRLCCVCGCRCTVGDDAWLCWRADSAFGPLKDDLTSSPLYSILKDANVDQLFVCGLASDYSVQYTVLDAKMVLPETKVFVVEDACRGVTAAGIQDAFRKFSMERVAVCDSKTEPISKFPVYQPPLKKCVASPRCCSLRAMAPGCVHTRVCVHCCCHDVHTGFAPHQVHECSRSQRHCQTLPVRRRARRLGRVSRHDDWWHHEISVVSQAPGRVLQQPPPP